MSTQTATKVALIGCGFAADYYVTTMANHPELSIGGVFDRDVERAKVFSSHHGLPLYTCVEELLAEEDIKVVVNLTSPESHFDVSRAAMLAGKHVYSEKPLAMTAAEGAELVRLSEERELVLSAAPCNLLGETAQTVWRAVRRGEIGRPQLVYASMDDGAIHRMRYRTWRSPSGAPWPYRSEFSTGCVLEHSGYYLNLLIAMFGQVTRVSSFATNIVRNVPQVDAAAPDFVSGCLHFDSGVVARLTCSIVAPADHSLLVVGDEGALTIQDAWDFGSPVHLRRDVLPERRRLSEPAPYPLVRECEFAHRYRGSHVMDFSRGVAEVAHAAAEGRPSRLPARHALHALEVMLAMMDGGERQFAGIGLDPIEPMPWAMEE